MSKIFERCMFRHIFSFMDYYLSKQQCGFRKGYSRQNCLLPEKWKIAVDKGKCFEALLTDLSKAFDCLSHELLIAELDAYGFDLTALKLIKSFLSNRKRGPKLMRRIAHEKKFCLEYHTDLFSVLCYLIFFCVICSG